MTAMNLYLAEARISELRESRQPAGRARLGMLLAETAQVLRGALTPIAGPAGRLGRGLSEDLNLR